MANNDDEGVNNPTPNPNESPNPNPNPDGSPGFNTTGDVPSKPAENA